MAVGDVVTGISSVIATTGTLDIKPSAGVEWVIHNIAYNGGTIELWKTDGTNNLKYDIDTTSGGRFNLSLHCTNAIWYQLKNISAAAVIASYDGMQTK